LLQHPDSKMSDEKHISDVWFKIDQLHWNFLHTGEKSDYLKGLVVEYLSLVPQNRRFNSATMGDIIAKSAKYKSDFSLVKAENAFRAIEKHVVKLITFKKKSRKQIRRPQRYNYQLEQSISKQESSRIQKHSGFYKDIVQSALSDPDKLFLEMGYYTRQGELYLPQSMVIIDRVIRVARDCLLACVECNQLAVIYSGVVTQFPVTLNEVIEFRRNHIGPVEDSVRELVFQKKMFQSQMSATTPLNGVKKSPHSDPPNQNNDWPSLARRSAVRSLPTGHQLCATTPSNRVENSSHLEPRNQNNDWIGVVADIKVNVERQLDVKKKNYEKLEKKKSQVDIDILEKENLLSVKEVQIFKDTEKMANIKEEEDILKKRLRSLQEEKENCMNETSDAKNKKVELVNEVKSLNCQKTQIESRLKSFKEVSLDKDETRKILQSLIQEKIDDLECPVCLVEATAPIFSCKEMHLICSSCSEKIASADNKCPICRGSYSNEKMRHRFAEKMSEKLEEMRKSLADMRLSD